MLRLIRKIKCVQQLNSKSDNAEMSDLNTLAVHNGAVHLENGCLDGVRRRQHRQADVDDVGTLGIKHCQLLPCTISFLQFSYIHRT